MLRCTYCGTEYREVPLPRGCCGEVHFEEFNPDEVKLDPEAVKAMDETADYALGLKHGQKS